MKKRDKKTGKFVKNLKKIKCFNCGIEFTPNGIQRKFCSQQCYWENTKGRESKKKNGKIIKCKVCGEEFYISKGMFGYRKYCSTECGQNDNWGFIPKKKICVICKKKFVIYSQLNSHKKTCSDDCHLKLTNKNQKERYQRLVKKKIVRRCKNCGKNFLGNALYKTEFCSMNCQWEYSSKKRKGKNNPAYRNGKYTESKKNITTTGKHLYACKKYKKDFIKRNGRIFCESCGSTFSLRFETHHILSAGRFPKNPNLHNQNNLILLCVQCHNDFHSEKRKEEYIKLVISRKLEKIFRVSLNSLIK